MKYIFVYKFFSRYAIWFIIAVAFILRAVKLKFAYYAVYGEMFRDLLVEYRFLHEGIWPLLGPGSSLGNYHFGAVYYYLLAPFVYLFNYRPLGMLVASLFFSLVSVYMVYRITLLWTANKAFALSCSFLVTISTFDIQNAYYVSNPNLLPSFILLFLYTVMYVVKYTQVNWYIYALLGFSAGIATQLHATATLIIPLFLLVAVFIHQICFYKRGVILALVTALFTYVPSLLYEFTHGFSNIRNLFAIGSHAFSFGGLVDNMASVVTIISNMLLFFNTFSGPLSMHPIAWFFLIILYLVLILVSVIAGVSIAKKSAGLSVISKLLIAFAAIGSMVLVFFGRGLQPYYFFVLWPLPVLFGAKIVYGYYTSRRMIYGVLVCFISIQVITLSFFYRHIDRTAVNYDHLSKVFAHVRDNSEGSANVVTNDLDLNMYAYYMHVYGLDSTRIPKGKVFAISSTGQSDPIIDMHQYILSEMYTAGSFTVNTYSYLEK